MNNFEYIKERLLKLNVSYKMLEVNTTDYSVDVHVKALGIKYREGLSTLIYRVDSNRYVAVLRRDDKNIDSKKLKSALGSSNVVFASEEDMNKLGMGVGLASPFLINDFPRDIKMELYVDKAALEMDKVIVGFGDASHAVEIQKDELLKNIGKYEVIDVSCTNPNRQDPDNVQIKRVLSGITPSGNALHIGNYFGAVKPQMDIQQSVEQSFYFVADLHALTTVQDKKKLENNILNNVLDFIALGLDPEKSSYFRQSDVPAHCQLAIVLANYIPYGYMQRMHAFKDKLQKGVSEESINMGLFNYPILMAADILLYKPDGVPVGEDQRQHIELARDVAQKFNQAYNLNIFPLPEPLIQGGDVGKVVGTDGERKMSKSLGNVIGIFDDAEVIKKQIFGCFTDINRKKATDPGKVEGNPVFIFHDLINDNKEEVADLKSRYKEGKVGDVEVKEKLFLAHQKKFAESKDKRKEIEGDINLAKEILTEGAKKAEKFALETLEEVYDVIGIKNDLSVGFRK